MADRIPLIVDSSSQQIKELPAGDSLILSDNERIKLGTSGDLEIYHDGSNSVIVDSGTGGLFLRGTDTVDIQSASGHNYIKSTISAGTQIYYNNVEKFKTLSTGAQVTGLLTATTSANISQVALTSASSVAWDARAAANAFLLLGHNVTFAAPTNAVEGAIISVEIAQPDPISAGPFTVAWNTVFEFAASTAPTMTATGLKTDIFSFRYNGSVWQEIGRVQNMAQT